MSLVGRTLERPSPGLRLQFLNIKIIFLKIIKLIWIKRLPTGLHFEYFRAENGPNTPPAASIPCRCGHTSHVLLLQSPEEGRGRPFDTSGPHRAEWGRDWMLFQLLELHPKRLLLHTDLQGFFFWKIIFPRISLFFFKFRVKLIYFSSRCSGDLVHIDTGWRRPETCEIDQNI